MSRTFVQARRGALHLGAAALLVAAAGGTALDAKAEVDEVRIAQQFGLHYLPLVIMQHNNLVEKAAAEKGLDDLKVTWAQFSGGAAVNTALLSNNVDFVAGGVGPLVKIWDKSKGNLNVKGVAAVSDMPMILTSQNPDIKSLEDFTEDHKIALPAVKVSMQAVTLQMGAAQAFGDENYEQLDKYTVSMKHPDGLAAMLSGQSEITAHFTAPPYSTQELDDPNIHKVTDSFEIYGGPATLIVLYTTEAFHEENPEVYDVVLTALENAMDYINEDKARAAQDYIDQTGSKLELEFVQRILEDPQIKYTTTPSSTQKIADFMHRIGSTSNKPESWKDMFFEEIHDLSGS